MGTCSDSIKKLTMGAPLLGLACLNGLLLSTMTLALTGEHTSANDLLIGYLVPRLNQLHCCCG